MIARLDLAKKLKLLSFEQRIVSVGRNGQIKTESTPSKTNDWSVRDTVVSGLHLRLTPGSMTWCVVARLGAKVLRRSIAHYQTIDNGKKRGGMPVAKARKIAIDWLALFSRGIDPLQAKKQSIKDSEVQSKREQTTLKKAYLDYCAANTGKSRKSTVDDRKKLLKWMDGAPIWLMPIVDIDRDAVDRTFQPLLDALTDGAKMPAWGPKSISKGTLDKMLAYTKAAYARSAHEVGLASGRGTGPFVQWKKDKAWASPPRRHTFLDTSSEQGRAWLRGLYEFRLRAHDSSVLTKRANPNGRDIKPHVSALVDFYLCVLLWGSRKDETAKLRFEYVNFEKGYVKFPAHLTKTKRDTMVPLTAWAAEILRDRQRWNQLWRPDATDDDWVFPSRERGLPLNNPRSILIFLKEHVGLWITSHDLRRTLATDLGAMDIRQEDVAQLLLVGAALNHVGGAGGSRVSAATDDYIQKQSDIKRPYFQRRENRLRDLCGLQRLDGSSDVSNGGALSDQEIESIVDRAGSDPTAALRLVERILKGQAAKKG